MDRDMRKIEENKDADRERRRIRRKKVKKGK